MREKLFSLLPKTIKLIIIFHEPKERPKALMLHFAKEVAQFKNKHTHCKWHGHHFRYEYGASAPFCEFCGTHTSKR